jgi:hypothetical protein
MPGKAKPGETGRPPLPLNLFYLVTAFQDDKDDVKTQALLGRAMSILHSHPVLGPAEIKDALAGSDLHEQIERIRVTLHPLSVEEMTKLWTVFQTQYRMSAAYQASVVLIESTRPAKTPLPVLRRGEDDRGVTSQADLESPFPALAGITLPGRDASLLLGQTLTLGGQHLDPGTLRAHFDNPHLTDPVPFTVKTRTETEVSIEADGAQAEQKWVAGFYSVSLELDDAGRVTTTNAVPLALAPEILTLPSQVQRLGLDKTATIPVTFRPEIRPAQRASLLWGDLEIPAPAHATQTDSLSFVLPHAPLGKRFVRLRIDGVDSLLIDFTADPPVFDPARMLEIHD